jgi:hypothetical protein
MRLTPACAVRLRMFARRVALVDSDRSSMPGAARPGAPPVGQVLAHQRFAAGEADAARTQAREGGDHAFDLVEAQPVLGLLEIA